MRAMGITCGRKGGNSEVLLKEALLACQEQGAEVSFINLHDFKINPCTGCEGCTINTMKGGKEPFCVWNGKDDYEAIARKMLEMDIIITSVPTYDLMPAAYYLLFAQRSLPFETSFLQKMGIIDEIPDRVGGLIAVGGSSHSWQSLALECLAATTFTTSIEVVDMMLAERDSAYGQVFLRPEQIARARKLGENLMAAKRLPKEQRHWMGEEDFGLCPICHSSAITKGSPQWDGVSFELECVVCGAGGNLIHGADGTYRFELVPDGDCRARTVSEKRELHLDEIMANHKQTAERRGEVMPQVEAYKAKELPQTLHTAFSDFR